MRKKIFFLAVLLSLAANRGFAQDWVALEPEAGTLGPGAKLAVKIADSFNLRMGGNGFIWRYHGKVSDIDYRIKARWLSFPALADWYIHKDGFRLTGGIIYNKNKMYFTSRPADDYRVGSAIYTAAQVGTLNSNVKFKTIAPYAGIGWGNPFTSTSDWSIGVDAGVMFQRRPRVALGANGSAASTPGFAINLEREKEDLQKRANKYRFYPVAAVSIGYSF